jgi:hypothetical protein
VKGGAVTGISEVTARLLDEALDMGEDVLQKFFRRNSELLLPSLATIRAQPLVR